MENSTTAVPANSSPAETLPKPTKQRRSVGTRRQIVEASLAPGATIARIAARHGVRPNQVSAWRKMYREGRLGGASAKGPRLVPVQVVQAGQRAGAAPDDRIELERARGQVRIVGQVHADSLRLVLESLSR